MALHETLWEKYLEGKATPEECREVASFFRSPDSGEGMPQAMAERIRARLERQALQEPQALRMPRRRWQAWAAAAAIILLAAVASLWVARRPAQEYAALWDTVSNANNEPRLVTFSDKTRIWLKSGSVLYISPTERRVRLTGEAYFDVTHSAKSPFVVESGGLITTVLGTTFDVTDNPVAVSLISGKVRVSREKDEVLLSPGETVMGSFQVEKTGVPDVAGWINGNLVLNELPLDEAIKRLGAYYGLIIRIEPVLEKGKNVTASYRRNEPWRQVLSHLLFIYHLTYIVDPDKSIRVIPQP